MWPATTGSRCCSSWLHGCWGKDERFLAWRVAWAVFCLDVRVINCVVILTFLDGSVQTCYFIICEDEPLGVKALGDGLLIMGVLFLAILSHLQHLRLLVSSIF